MFSFVDKLIKIRQFWKTRNYVRRGENIFDWDQAKIEAEGLMGPWSLNIFESVLAITPALLLLGAANILLPKATFDFKLFEERNFEMYSMYLPAEVIEARKEEIEARKNDREIRRQKNKIKQSIRGKLHVTTQALVLPLGLMLFSTVVGRTSFRYKDQRMSREERLRAKYAYLYLDGSYGLFPQALYVLAIAAIQIASVYESNSLTERAFQVVPFLLIIAILWNFEVTFRTIPRRLFEINGYSKEAPAFFLFWKKKIVSNPAPWRQYSWSIWLVGGVLLYLLALGLAHFATWLSNVIASFIFGLQGI